MFRAEEITDNFKLLIPEIETQLGRTKRFFHAPGRSLYEKMLAKEGYINNLKTIIEDKCYRRIIEHKKADSRHINRIRAMLRITANLERIADVCINIMEQMGHVKEHRALKQHEYEPMFQVIEEALDKILPAFEQSSLPLALRICRAEFMLDALYKSAFERLVKELESDNKCASDLVTLIFIYRYLERIGDHLLNVGESLIFAILGQRIKIEQFDSLQQTLELSGFQGSFEQINFQAIWGSRSGCHIGKIGGDGENLQLEHGSLYKEGSKAKVLKEKENIDEWHKLFPRLVPQVFGYNEDGDNASLLVEFLSGCPFDEVAIGHPEDFLQNAMFIIVQTLCDIWEATLVRETTATDYMDQLEARLSDVYQVHPKFMRREMCIGEVRQESIESLISACKEIEKKLTAPLNVFIHGDFNTNNLIYNHQDQSLRFIDLHRSRHADYVQDVSVFLVSNFRQPFFESGQRARLEWVMREMYVFAQNFAEEKGDRTMQARMALALARSFFTSSRFELNTEFAHEMYLRAVFLLENLLEYDQKGMEWENYTLPEGILSY